MGIGGEAFCSDTITLPVWVKCRHLQQKRARFDIAHVTLCINYLQEFLEIVVFLSNSKILYIFQIQCSVYFKE